MRTWVSCLVTRRKRQLISSDGEIDDDYYLIALLNDILVKLISNLIFLNEHIFFFYNIN